MYCPECRFENKADAGFCMECGAKLETPCPDCGRVLPSTAKFCDNCGSDLRESDEPSPIDYSRPRAYTPRYLADKILTTRSSIEGERKLVTVLFADVANYTSISEKLDPEEVHQIMDGFFRILMGEIHRYEGTINQFTGDGVMALFGAPVAHEDHARRGCHAALSILKAIEVYGEKIKGQHGAEFALRMGLNSGPVIVGSIGDDLRMDYTALGDTTNLAHRMQDMSNPGSVLVSGHTHRLAMDFFEFASIGKIELQGKEEPQEAHELIRPGKVETRFEAAAAKGLTRFVGREEELETLKQAFRRVASGSGEVIEVVGEAGVGKSRLLLELRGILPEGKYSYLEGRCFHYGGSMPYLPILDVLKVYFEVEEEDREATIKEKVRDRLLQLDEEAEVVPPALHEVLSLKVEDERYPRLVPQQRREKAFETIRDILVRESQRKPLILAVEDLHWIDRTSDEFLDYLIGFLPDARILLILLHRPEYTHMWGSKSQNGRIALDQLSAQTSAELVQAILEGGDMAPEIAGLVLGRAGGNPLFVEELTHSLVENGSIRRKDDKYVLARKSNEIDVPDTIQGIIAGRMDRIADNLKQIIQVASVIGREFAYRILLSIVGMSEDLRGSLLDLQGLEFIYEKQLLPELEYIFKHALTQEVAYNSLLLKRRKDIHERIGRAMEDLYAERLEEYYELLAYHYVRSENREKAVEYLDLANQKATKAYALENAKAYYEEAMKLLDALPPTPEHCERRISLLANQWILMHLLLKIPEYYACLMKYEPSAAALGITRLMGAFYSRLAWCRFLLGYVDQSIETSTRAAEYCVEAGDTENAAHTYMTLQLSLLLRGDYDRALANKDEVLSIMEERFDANTYSWTLSFAAWAYAHLGRWKDANQAGQAALEVAQEVADHSLVSYAAWALAYACTHRGDTEQAIEYATMAGRVAPTPFDQVAAQAVLGWAWCRSGHSEKGVELLEEVTQIGRLAGIVIAELGWLPLLAEGYFLRGLTKKAKQTTLEILEKSEGIGSRYVIGWSHRLLGEIALETNPEGAPSLFKQAVSVFREIRAENEVALAYSGMGRYHKRKGNMEQAREYLTKALEIFERLGTLIEPDKVRELLADLPSIGNTKTKRSE